jgi:catalase
MGAVRSEKGANLDVEMTLETAPSVLFDALVIPDGEAATQSLSTVGQAMAFVRDTYRHCKPILAVGAGRRLVEAAHLPQSLPDGRSDPGLLLAKAAGQGTQLFIAAVAKHRHFERQTDPPRV